MMVAECCGKKRTCNFCPDCGNKLSQGPLVDLLAHCRLQQKTHESRAEAQRRRGEDVGRYHEDEDEARRYRADYLKDSESFARSAAKWKLWGDTLAATIEDHE